MHSSTSSEVASGRRQLPPPPLAREALLPGCTEIPIRGIVSTELLPYFGRPLGAFFDKRSWDSRIMPVTETDFEFLRLLAKYRVLTRDQLQRLRGDKKVSDRAVRKHLLKLQQSELIKKHRIPVLMTGSNGAAPVYYVTKAGAIQLAEYCEDDTFLKTNTNEPRGDRLNHWIAINESRMVLEAAVKSVPGLSLDQWINEWEEIDKAPGSRPSFTLHTQLHENPPLSCSPDAGFVLSFQGHTKVYYLEEDLGTSSVQQVAARKSKGYAELARQQLHRTHFPTTTIDSFSVLVVTTTRYRCIGLVRELRKQESSDLWRMVAASDFVPERVMSEPVFFGTDAEEPRRFLKVPTRALQETAETVN